MGEMERQDGEMRWRDEMEGYGWDEREWDRIEGKVGRKRMEVIRK